MKRRMALMLLMAALAPAASPASAATTAGMHVQAGPAKTGDNKQQAGAAPGIRLTRWTVDTGGGLVGSGGWQLHATVGQPEPGFASGGSYALQSGFWFGTRESRLFADGFE